MSSLQHDRSLQHAQLCAVILVCCTAVSLHPLSQLADYLGAQLCRLHWHGPHTKRLLQLMRLLPKVGRSSAVDSADTSSSNKDEKLGLVGQPQLCFGKDEDCYVCTAVPQEVFVKFSNPAALYTISRLCYSIPFAVEDYLHVCGELP